MAFYTCPDHLSWWLRKTAIISSLSNLWTNEAKGVSSVFWCHRSSRLWHGHCGGATAGHTSEAFGPHVSLPWSILPRGGRLCTPCCTPYVTGAWWWGQANHKSFLNTTSGGNGTVIATHQSTAYHLGRRKWPAHQAWCRNCRWHPLQSLACHRWAEPCRYTWGRRS